MKKQRLADHFTITNLPSRLYAGAVVALLSCLLFCAAHGQSGGVPVPGSGELALPTGQMLDYVTVQQIHIAGNKRTKNDIILRELDFAVGDTISLASLAERVQKNEFNVLNTGLFTAANIRFKEWKGATNEVGLLITVMEGWYVFPFPILELADRNFNVWWETYDRSLRRLNIGVRFYHNNFTGRRDVLKLVGQLGFTKKYELIYTLPYFNKSKTLGVNINFLNTSEKEIGYNTVDNDLVFHRNDDHPLMRRLRFGGGALFRRRLNTFHRWDLTYHYNRIDGSVKRELNPDFFLGGLQQRYLALQYSYILDRRDIRPYPMHGQYLETTVQKLGFGLSPDINALNLSAQFHQYFSFSDRWSLGLVAKGKAGLIREKQPYYNSIALGYLEDFVRGYELYVIDGLDFALQKTHVRFKFLQRELNLSRYVMLDAFKRMPVKLFGSLRNEVGYVNNPFYKTGNPLSNQLLWGTTLGLDVVLFYDKVINFEISRNHLNEYGFFLHWAFSF